MKTILYLFLLIYLLTGCQKESTQVKTLLQQAENYMDEHPDSALSVLQNLSIDTLQGEQRADYALLYTQACDKNYITHTSDSLIQIAVKYYSNKEGEVNAAKSYYYLGCVYRDLKNQVNAIKCWLKALQFMPKNSNDRTLMLIYNNLANKYNNQELFKEAMDMHWNAYRFSLRQKDTVDLLYSLRGITQVYLMEDKADSALLYSQKAYQIAQKCGDQNWEANILDDMAKIYLYRKNDSITAYRYITASLEKDSLTPALILKAQLLLGRKQYDSARIFLSNSHKDNDFYNNASRYFYLYLVERYTGNHSLAYAYNDSMLSYRDSIHALEQHQKVKDLSLSYELATSKKELQMQKKVFHYTLIGIFIGIILIAFAFYQYREKKYKEEELKKQVRKFDSNIEALNEYLEEQGGESLEVTKAVYRHKKNKAQECINQFKQTEWLEKLAILTPAQEKSYITSEEQFSLYETLNTIFEYFIVSLRKECPTMNEGDIYYCLLAMIGYKTKIISYCVQLSTNALRTRKSRMKQSLSKETFDFFFESEE